MFLYTGELCVRWRQQVCTKIEHTPKSSHPNDHLAKDAAALEHVIKIDLLDRFGPQVLAHDLGCDQNDGAVTVGFIKVFASPATGSSSISELFTNPGVQGGFR